MGLSNAERQKRYREKLKAAARGNASVNLAVALGHDVDAATAEEWGDLLNAHYRRGGQSLLALHLDRDAVDDIAQAALDEFLATAPTALEQLEIMEAAGQAAACKIFERRADEWYRARATVPVAVMEPTTAPNRRTKRPVT